MRTTLTIDDSDAKELLKATHAPTLAGAVAAALKTFIRRERLKGIMALKGKIKFEEGFDYKELRKDRKLPWNE